MIKTKKVVVIVGAVITLVVLTTIVSLVFLNKKKNNNNKLVKEVNENIGTQEKSGSNMIYYYSKFKYDNDMVKSIETSHTLDFKIADFMESYEYKKGKLSKIVLRDNEYDEADEENNVSYDKEDNMQIENSQGYYKYKCKDLKMNSIVSVDTGSN